MLSYAYINRDYMKDKPKFWLCLPYPRRTGIRKLTEIYNVNFKFIMGRVHELTFDIPVKVNRNNQLVNNPLIELFEGYYLVKMEWNNAVTYFVYVNGNRKLDKSGKNLSYKLYSTAHLIGKHAVPLYEEESKTLEQHATEFLKETNWIIGHIDDYFKPNVNTKAPFRELTASQSNSLQCLYDLAEKFEAILDFDTVNQEVSFYYPPNLEKNKGMVFKDGITLESLGQTIDYDAIVTRLHVYGSDGLEFRELSLTGVNYIQDLEWFIYPFEQDEHGNVIKSSKSLTDEFCIAYRTYQQALNAAQPIFDNLTTQLTNKEDEITQLNSSLSSLQMTLNQIENDLWVINKTYQENASSRPDWQNATTRRNNTQSQISSMKNNINSKELEVESLRTQIENLRLSLQLRNYFTSSQIEEFNNSIHHGYYTNSAIVDTKDLLEDGKKAFAKVNRPPITVTMNVVNFFNDIKFEKLRDRIALGDTVKVKSEDLGIYVSLKIIEITYNLSNDSINLTVSNEQDLRDGMAKLTDQLYSASHASTIVETNKGDWSKGKEAFEEVNKVIKNPWDASKTYIIGGYDNTTMLNKNGLVSYEQPNSNTYLFINNSILGITDDNLNTLKVAIDKDGVRANVIQGDLILGNNLKLTSDSGVLEADGETITIRDSNGDVKVELGKYIDSNNQATYGLNIIGGAFNLRTSANSNEGTVINGEGIKVYDSNGNVVFDTSNPNDLQYSGSINLSGDTEVRGRLIFKDNTTGEGVIYYRNGGLHFESDVNFHFYNDIFLHGVGRKMYIDGKEVLTAP